MKKPLSFTIGMRYTRAKRRNHFISFISLASMLGIALGVTVLITVLSVMNGFDQQIRDKFFAITPAVTVETQENIEKTWEKVIATATAIPEVANAAPYVSGNGMILKGRRFDGVSLMGILPKDEERVSQLNKHMVLGKLSSLQSGKYNAVIGESLASTLNVSVGDQINVLTPQTNVTLLGIFPRYKTFRISGIYHTTGGLYDNGVLFINMHDAEKLFLPSSRVSGIHLRLHNLYQAPIVTAALQNVLSPEFSITNWTIQYGSFFQALAMEKTMLFVILLLIVAVAAFNLVSTLVMAVNDKRADIAILRTLGARPKTIMMTFMIQGLLIGLMGTVLGLIGGLLLASHVTEITNWLQQVFHTQFIRSDVYFINFLPSQIKVSDVIEVCAATMGFSFLATIYPAMMAYKTQPAEALRYE